MALTPSAIAQNLLRIVDEGTEPLRRTLDPKLHVLDISYQSVKSAYPKLTSNEYEQLINSIRLTTAQTSSLKEAMTTSRLLYVDDAKYGTYLIAGTYKDIQLKLSTVLENAKTSNVVATNIDAATSPMSLLLSSIVTRAPLATVNPIVKQLHALETTQTNKVTYRFQREGFDTAGFNNILGTASVLIGFTSKDSNTAAVERDVKRKVKEYLGSDEFKSNIIESRKESKSLLDELQAMTLAVLRGETYKSKSVSATATSKVVNTSKQVVNSLKLPKVPQLRDVSGKFYSLTSLQVLLNTHLQDVISANMGNEPYLGGQRKILNYRTGRFASSVEVTRLTQSKEGMITAFYAYMKYPYQTFEPGFAQGFPNSRDPKLLISKSIKEIAAAKVGNRMRAVLI